MELPSTNMGKDSSYIRGANQDSSFGYKFEMHAQLSKRTKKYTAGFKNLEF